MGALIAVAVVLVLVGAAFVLLNRKQGGERVWGPAHEEYSKPVWVEVRAGPNVGEWYALTGDPLTIGSAPSNVLGIEDRSVGYRHATIYPFYGGWLVKDNGEGGVTTINDIPLRRGSVRLYAGDTIMIGPLRLRVHESPPGRGISVHEVGGNKVRPIGTPAPIITKEDVDTDGHEAPLFEPASGAGNSKMHGGSKWRRPPTRKELERVVQYLEEEEDEESSDEAQNPG